jgi:hypothetical protein
MDDKHDLEQQLKSALAREEAPAWFEARVMNAVNREAPSKRVNAQRPRWQWILVTTTAAVAVIGVGSEWQHHVTMERVKMAHFEMEQREAGEAAKAKLQLALRITSTKLLQIQQRIEEASQ